MWFVWLNIALFVAAFALLWIGSGLAVGSITKIAHSLRMSSFFVSFFVLGLFTSLTEIMVGINALYSGTPEIFVGNLIGSSVVVFLLIIPLLAVIGRGVSLNHKFTFRNLVTAVGVVGLPALLTLDGKISAIDAVLCILVYSYFLYTQERKAGYLERLVVVNFNRPKIYWHLANIIFAIVLVYTGAQVLVKQTMMLADLYTISPFIISILVISVGTNIPELSIAVRAVMAKKKDIAFGNYVGSAALNTIELGILSLIGMRQQPILATGSNYAMVMFLVGLALFLYFGKSRNTISRYEGIGLLGAYLLFVVFELLTGPGWKW
jgi:cation:H+ antiporter